MSRAIRYARAQSGADAAAIAALLEATPIEGAVRLAMSRGRDPLNSAPEAERSAFFLARRGDEAVGVCERATWRCFVGGKPALVPYLGALRLSPRAAGRIDVLRQGFALVRGLQQPDETAFALTSIAADNHRALRLLTSGVRGLPRYRRIGGYTTFALRARRRACAFAPAQREDYPELAAFLNRSNQARDFAPVWSPEALDRLAGRGLPPQHILLQRRAGRIVASSAVWDRRDARPITPVAYAGWTARLRPLINAVAALSGRPSLPPPGAPIDYAAVALLAAEDAAGFDAAIEAAVDRAARLGFAVAAVGLGSACPEARSRALGASARLSTWLYAVSWEDRAESDGAAFAAWPELGFL